MVFEACKENKIYAFILAGGYSKGDIQRRKTAKNTLQ
jgi:hypothetical protein